MGKGPQVSAKRLAVAAGARVGRDGKPIDVHCRPPTFHLLSEEPHEWWGLQLP